MCPFSRPPLCHVPTYLWHWRKDLCSIFSPIMIYLYSVQCYPVQCFGYPTSYHYYMLILINTQYHNGEASLLLS